MNAQEKQQFLTHWESERRGGMLRYVLVTAIIWGSFVAVFGTLIQTLVEDGFSLEQLKPACFSGSFLWRWLSFLLGGLGYGFAMWFYFERRYRRVKAETEKPDAAAPGPHHP